MPEDNRDHGRERGWYLDPDHPHSHRFWTGTRWMSLQERLPDLARAERPPSSTRACTTARPRDSEAEAGPGEP